MTQAYREGMQYNSEANRIGFWLQAWDLIGHAYAAEWQILVIGPCTRGIGRKAKTIKSARRMVDKLDLQYGAASHRIVERNTRTGEYKHRI